MKIFLPCWGDKHIKLFSQAAGRTLAWPKNKASVKGSEWCVLTNGEFNEKDLTRAITTIDEDAKITFNFCTDLMTSNADKGPLLLSALLKVVRKCLDDKEPLLMVTPDYVYGDGTIEAIKQVAGNLYSVSFAHMRVEKKILDELTDPMTNIQVQSLGMKNPHATWTKSHVEADPGFTFWGGIMWRDITKNLYAVTHYLPAPFFVNFHESDLEFFKAKHPFPHDKLTFALWDHLFPTKLIQEGRLRYIGSSDLACMIEATETEDNWPDHNPVGIKNGDGYVKTTRLPVFHNMIHQQFVSCFRGEE